MRGETQEGYKGYIAPFHNNRILSKWALLPLLRKKILNIIIVNTSKMNCKNMIGILDIVLFQPIPYVSYMYLFVSTYDESFAHFHQMLLCY